jgi:hypothetical protein
VEAHELVEHDLLGVSVVVLQQLDSVDRREGEQRLLRPGLRRAPLLDRTELAVQDRNQEIAVTGRRLEEGLEHPVDHGARREDLAVGLNTVTALHHLLLDDRLRYRVSRSACGELLMAAR